MTNLARSFAPASISHRFPVGASVAVVPAPAPDNLQRPCAAAPLDTATVDDNGLSFASLPTGTRLALYALVNGKPTYHAFSVEAAPSAPARMAWQQTVAARRAAAGTS